MVGDNLVQKSEVDGAVVRVEAEVVRLTDNVLNPIDDTWNLVQFMGRVGKMKFESEKTKIML